ncbi:MAG: hypothetical protein IJK71_04825 [Clostridia bacterium]|nr:hypothetical protein [Clostridia bacterium]
MKTKAWFMVLAVIMSLFVLCTCALADSWAPADPNWNVDKSKLETSYNLTKTYKYNTSKIWYSAKSTKWTAYKRLTSSFKHYKGESNQTRGMSTSYTHTFQGSFSGKDGGLIKNYGINLGYSYSFSSTSTVSDSISATLKDGWYYYGQRGKTKDFKYLVHKETYKKNSNGKYVLEKTDPDQVSKATLLDPATYCTWVYDCPIDD